MGVALGPRYSGSRTRSPTPQVFLGNTLVGGRDECGGGERRLDHDTTSVLATAQGSAHTPVSRLVMKLLQITTGLPVGTHTSFGSRSHHTLGI